MHDRRRTGSIAPLHSSVRFIDDEVEPIGFFANGVAQRFPDGVCPTISMLCQIAAASELLCIQKIDISVVERFLIEGIIGDGDTLVKTDFISLHVDFILRLLIQLRRV